MSGGQSRGARPLFVAGPPRSGTTALVDYLNAHPQILVCMERYKYIPREIRPDLLTFERILDYRPGETSWPRKWHLEVLARKSPERLMWAGDKCPQYVKYLRTLARNNPGACFLITYRPVEEVARSFEARARGPNPRWPSQKGFGAGINAWNRALLDTRRFIERSFSDRVLIVDQRRLRSDPDSIAASAGSFLGIGFDAETREEWRRRSTEYRGSPREEEPLSEPQRRLVAERKDADTERWILDRIVRQDAHALPRRATQPWATLDRLSDRAVIAARRVAVVRDPYLGSSR